MASLLAEEDFESEFTSYLISFYLFIYLLQFAPAPGGVHVSLRGCWHSASKHLDINFPPAQWEAEAFLDDISTPAPCLRLRLADDSQCCELSSQHPGDKNKW